MLGELIVSPLYHDLHSLDSDLGLVWYGMVWFGMVWFGLVWFVLVCYGLVWFGLVDVVGVVEMVSIVEDVVVMTLLENPENLVKIG